MTGSIKSRNSEGIIFERGEFSTIDGLIWHFSYCSRKCSLRTREILIMLLRIQKEHTGKTGNTVITLIGTLLLLKFYMIEN